MSTTSRTASTPASPAVRLRDAWGTAAGLALFAALTWASAQWLAGPLLPGASGYVLLMCVALTAGAALAALVLEAGISTGVGALLLVLLGRLIGEPAGVSVPRDGLQLPQLVIRSGAHQPIVTGAAVAVLTVGLAGAYRQRAARRPR